MSNKQQLTDKAFQIGSDCGPGVATTDNTQIPVEVVEEIEAKALALYPPMLRSPRHMVQVDMNADSRMRWEAGATAYATKLVECDRANRALEEKNRQLLKLLEANFKEFLSSHKCMTEEEIGQAWETYKKDNNL